MTCHVATNHSSSPHVTSQPSTLLHLTPQATSWHQNRSHHGTAEGSFTAKKWFGHRAGRSPCAHSIGKFFLWLIFFFFETSAPGLSGHYWYRHPKMIPNFIDAVVCVQKQCLKSLCNLPMSTWKHVESVVMCLFDSKTPRYGTTEQDFAIPSSLLFTCPDLCHGTTVITCFVTSLWLLICLETTQIQ